MGPLIKTYILSATYSENLRQHIPATDPPRVKARREMKKDTNVVNLLYTEEGTREVMKIWREFDKARREIKVRQGREESEDRDNGMG